MLFRLTVLGTLAAAAAGSAACQTQTDYAAQAKLAAVAFRCEEYALVASMGDKESDAARLFAIGYLAAQFVFQARHKSIDTYRSDETSDGQLLMLWTRLGPSSEFDVGDAHRIINDLAFETISEATPGGARVDNVLAQKAAAQKLYRDANCSYVGK